LEDGQEAEKAMQQPYQVFLFHSSFTFLETCYELKEREEYGVRFNCSSDAAATIYMHQDS